MDSINGNVALASYSAATKRHSKKAGSSPFQALLASATASASVNAAGNTVAATATSPASVTPTDAAKFVSALNTALNAYGVGTPPSLRITSGPDGLQLSDDVRNEKFQTMIKNEPELGKGLNGMLDSATAGRKADLSNAMEDFGGKTPTGTVRDFLKGFKESEKAQGFSVSFNGASATVDELDAQGWQPVKGKAAITNDMLAAYGKYLTQFGVSTETHKDDKYGKDGKYDKDGKDSDSDPDIGLKKKIAETAAG
jgi:hypothetical protein